MKNYYVAALTAGLIETLTQAVREDLVLFRLSGLVEMWSSLLGGPGIFMDLVFYGLLAFGSILAGFAVVSEGFAGFYIVLCGFLGAYSTLLGLMVSEWLYMLIGLILVVSGALVSIVYEKEAARKEYRAPYI